MIRSTLTIFLILFTVFTIMQSCGEHEYLGEKIRQEQLR